MSDTPIVAFIDSVHPILWEFLEGMGFTCVDYSESTEESIRRDYSKFTGIVLRSKFQITSEILDQCQQLKFIARSGSGMENIDTKAAISRGVKCFNSPEGNRDALAEHTIGMLLMLFNKLNKADSEVRQRIWDREGNRGVELMNKTVGIIGYGTMGKAFAQRLSGFGCKVIAYDKFKKGFSDEFVQEVDWKTFVKEADIVSLHVNYLPENEFMIDSSFFDSFPKPIYIINTARGKCLNTKSLIDAMSNGKVLGACLDVLEFESVSFDNDYKHPFIDLLLKSEDVVLSPHVAGWTKESYEKLSLFLAKKIKESLNSIAQ